MNEAKAPESRLQVEVLREPGSNLIVVKLDGRLDIFTYRALGARLDSSLENGTGLKLIVDLRGVSFVASSGWSVFIAARARLKRSGGRMAFVGLGGELRRVFEAMKMNDLIQEFDHMEEAKEAFGAADGISKEQK